MRTNARLLLNRLSVALLITSPIAFAQDDKHQFSSLQMKGVDPVTVDVNVEAAARRLSRGVQFPTISNENRQDFDVEAFKGYHQFLEQVYPNVHKTVKKEVLGNPRPYSLLYTWEGKDPSLPPVVLMAHQDVVPIVEATRHQWEYDPFAGTIDRGYLWGRGS